MKRRRVAALPSTPSGEPASRAQTISEFGYYAVFTDPPTSTYKCGFDHEGQRRSRHQ